MAIERRRTSQTWLLAAAALLATALAIGRDPGTRPAEGGSELAGDVGVSGRGRPDLPSEGR